MDGLDLPGTVLAGEHHQLGTLRVDLAVSDLPLGNTRRVSPRDIAKKFDLDLTSFPGYGLSKAHVCGKMAGAITLLVFDTTALEDRHVRSKMTERRNRIASGQRRVIRVDDRTHLNLCTLLTHNAAGTRGNRDHDTTQKGNHSVVVGIHRLPFGMTIFVEDLVLFSLSSLCCAANVVTAGGAREPVG